MGRVLDRGAEGLRHQEADLDADRERAHFDRNKDQLDIQLRREHRSEPRGPVYGQPTHFHSGRQWGVFSIGVPKDFGTKKLTWTLPANGHTSTVQFWLNPPYWIDFFKNG